jgi:hypothetical protein
MPSKIHSDLKAAMPRKGLYIIWSQPSSNPCGDWRERGLGR